MSEKLDLLKRVKVDIETVLFNPTGVNAQELTDLRDRIVAEIALETPADDVGDEDELEVTAQG